MPFRGIADGELLNYPLQMRQWTLLQ